MRQFSFLRESLSPLEIPLPRLVIIIYKKTSAICTRIGVYCAFIKENGFLCPFRARPPASEAEFGCLRRRSSRRPAPRYCLCQEPRGVVQSSKRVRSSLAQTTITSFFISSCMVWRERGGIRLAPVDGFDTSSRAQGL